MNLFRVQFLVALALLFCMLPFGKTQEEEAEEDDSDSLEKKSCQKVIFDLLSVVFEAAAPCIPKLFMVNKSDRILSQAFCTVKCVMNELGILDADGYLDQGSAGIFFAENVPSELRGQIVDKIDPCFKLAESIDPKEYYCKSYAAVSQCSGTVVTNVLLPYIIQCFGSPFIAAGMNAVFGILTSKVPSRGPMAPVTLNLNSGRNKTLYLPASWRNITIPKFQLFPRF